MDGSGSGYGRFEDAQIGRRPVVRGEFIDDLTPVGDGVAGDTCACCALPF